MMQVLQVVILGLALGFVYALMVSGLTLIFGVMRIVNLAHPILIITGAANYLITLNTLIALMTYCLIT